MTIAFFLRRAVLVVLLLLAVSVARAENLTLNDADLIWLPSGARTAPNLAVPAQDTSIPIVAPGKEGEAAQILRLLDAAGLANGFAGILYDNRDRGHSVLAPRLFPRLYRLSYGFELMAGDADYGLAGGILLPAVVFGNSSTAITQGRAPRSLPRFAMTARGAAEAQARLYKGNHLYIYPEHRDHDETDLFPANWPYMIATQGSSGSDQPFLEAIAMTLAAFRPETLGRMRDMGLVAPTLQSILRQSLTTSTSAAGALEGAANPVVFDAALLRPDQMVAAAAALEPGAIPPMVRIRVVEEDFSDAAGLAAESERLYDTPSAIARIWRNFAWDRSMTISAEATEDPNGRPLIFSWRLLQGNADRVKIMPLGPEGRRAKIRLAWHDPFDATGPDRNRTTSRVDIGVFAWNGVTMSAPAILSVAFPAHERRIYAPGPDGVIALLSIDYDAIGRGQMYDPVLYWSAPWTDAPVKGASGDIATWIRTARDGTATRVPAVSSDSGAAPAYRIDGDSHDRTVLIAEPTTP